ncbi:MAG: hypothetical protein JRE40_09180 [Deltaproteobacteria bacterium]|nr:hypothetical protein [Deltaproteobacteria bacterium]MBW2673720.1 hypothetical protein [Deltaproteobacteria bacterium]
MGTCNVYIPEHLERIAKRHARDLSSAVEEDLTALYALLTMTGEEMEEYLTKQEMSLLCEVFKNDEFESARIREWPALLAWDLEDVEKYEKLSAQFKTNAEVLIEKLEVLTPLQALWLLHTIRRCGDTETG